MSGFDDFPSEMDRFPFDDSAADAVFGASPGSDPVPEDLRDVAELVFTARRAGSRDELAGEVLMVANLAAAIGEHAASPLGDAHERTPVLKRYRAAKLTAAATAVLMLGGTAAAAATGSLPSPVPHHHHHAELAVEPVGAPAVHARHHVRRKHAPDASGVVPPRPTLVRTFVSGMVASVNSVSDAGTCGVSGAAGTFTVIAKHDKTFTVNVDTTTHYVDKDAATPTFVNVCVGSLVLAKGTVADPIVTATDVYVAPIAHEEEHKKGHHHGRFGTVASVNGVSVAGTCGSRGATGTFTVTAKHDTTSTVNVDGNTTFFAPGTTGPSFANVCVGAKVGAVGDATDTTITATKVFVLPAHMGDDHGRKGDDAEGQDDQGHDGQGHEAEHHEKHQDFSNADKSSHGSGGKGDGSGPDH